MIEGLPQHLAYDLYPGDDPIDGTRLVRLTEADCQSGTKWRKVGRGTGQLLIILRASHAAVLAGHFVEGVYCRVVDVTPGFSEKVIGGGFLRSGDEVVISKDLGGGEFRTLVGPGTLDVFRNARFPPVLRSTADASLAQHQVYMEQNGFLRFTGPETYGGIMGRVFAEAQLDVPTALPSLPAHTWDDATDSGGTPWPVFDGSYDVLSGANVLEVFYDLMRKGIDLFIDPDTFVAAAYLAGTFGVDRTSATFTAGKVRFERGVNIRSDLSKAIHDQVYASMVMAFGQDGVTFETGFDPDWNVGEFVSYARIDVPGTNDRDILLAAAEESIRLRKLATSQARFPIVTGNDPAAGTYFAGRDFDVLDLVTLHTGSGPHEFDEEPIQVAAIEWEIRDSPRHEVTVELGAQYMDAATARQIENLTTIIREPHPAGVLFCQPITGIPPIVDDAAYSLSFNDPIPNFVVPALFDGILLVAVASYSPGDPTGAKWTVGGTDYAMTAIAGASGRNGSGPGVWWYYLLDPVPGTGYITPLGSGNFHTGCVLMPGATGAAAEDFNTGTGTAAAIGTPVDTNQRRVSSLVAFSTDAAALGTDPTISAGGSVDWSDGWDQGGPGYGEGYFAGGDSTQDADTWTLPKSFPWALGSVLVAGSGSTDGIQPQMVGTSEQVKRCDDTEHYHASGTPTVDDDLDHGFRYGTLWANEDDGALFLLIDGTPGAAVWLEVGGITQAAVEALLAALAASELATHIEPMVDSDGHVMLDSAGFVSWHEVAN